MQREMRFFSDRSMAVLCNTSAQSLGLDAQIAALPSCLEF